MLGGRVGLGVRRPRAADVLGPRSTALRLFLILPSRPIAAERRTTRAGFLSCPPCRPTASGLQFRPRCP
eukprot:8956825-Pyramimonas_sp.AAC.1